MNILSIFSNIGESDTMYVVIAIVVISFFGDLLK